MSTTIVTVRDHLQGLSTTLVYTQEHKAPVHTAFKALDPLLMHLQHRTEFRGCLRLSDLDAIRFRILIGMHLSMMADLTAAQRMDERNVTMRSLDWLLVGYLHFLEGVTASKIAALTLTRISEEHVLYDSTLHAEGMVTKAEPPKNPGLRVVVDNETL